MVLLRRVIGDALRARRLAQHRTLRQVSTAANVSLGYLSEIERGHKEASSELLAAICDALGARLSEMLSDVNAMVSLAEQMDDVVAPVGSDAKAAAESGDTSVTDGNVTVQVHSDGPLRTTLQARIGAPGPPGPRRDQSVYVG
jgi:transcriptional regulator with XRE-family HTH domain